MTVITDAEAKAMEEAKQDEPTQGMTGREWWLTWSLFATIAAWVLVLLAEMQP